MMPTNRSSRSDSRDRRLRPVMVSLEDRVLLNAAMPHDMHGHDRLAEVQLEGHLNRQKKPTGPSVALLSTAKCRRLHVPQFQRSERGHERRRRDQSERNLELGHLGRL